MDPEETKFTFTVEELHTRGVACYQKANGILKTALDDGDRSLTPEERQSCEEHISSSQFLLRASENQQKMADSKKKILDSVKFLSVEEEASYEDKMSELNVKLHEMGSKRLVGAPEVLDMGLTEALGKNATTTLESSARFKADYSTSPLTAGGHALRPNQLMNRIITRKMNRVWVGGLATHILTNAPSIDMVTFAETFTFAQIDPGFPYTAHSVADDAFGKQTLTPRKHGMMWKVDKELFDDSAFDIASLLINKVGDALAMQEEVYMLLGTGVKQPAGILNPTATVIPAANIITTGTTDIITPTELRQLPYRLTAEYRKQSSGWMVHRNTLSYLYTLRDDSGGAGTGLFIWSPSMIAGQPITIDGFPVMETEYMTDPGVDFDPAPADVLVAFGDFSQYLIADRQQLEIELSDQVYWTTDKIAFKANRVFDAGLSVLESFAKIVNA